VDDLWRVGQDPRIWEWFQVAPNDEASFRSYYAKQLAGAQSRALVPFATLDAATGEPIGGTAYTTLRPEHRGVEIGYTWLSPAEWGTGANAEAKFLLLEHAFEEVGCMRVEFKTEARNERARRALEALPAEFEGVFRKHLVRPYGIRDSACYSIVDEEWPAVRANLERRLASRA
jgi:RimJ/RimL family protein N-acetyltransferase